MTCSSFQSSTPLNPGSNIPGVLNTPYFFSAKKNKAAFAPGRGGVASQPNIRTACLSAARGALRPPFPPCSASIASGVRRLRRPLRRSAGHMVHRPAPGPLRYPVNPATAPRDRRAATTSAALAAPLEHRPGSIAQAPTSRRKTAPASPFRDDFDDRIDPRRPC